MSTSRRIFLKNAAATASLAALPFALPQIAFAAGSTTLTIAQSNDILSLDPANHENNSTQSALVNLYEYLVNKEFPNGKMAFTPGLAKSWKQEDPRTWVFELRSDVQWHDGKPFTAEDVKFTVERMKGNPKLLSAVEKFRSVETVEVLGPHRVRLVTSKPDPLFLHNFVGNGGSILPQHAFKAAGSEEAFFAKPIGTGPYKFVEWKKADRLVLARNPQWWGGAPHWERVVIRAIPETATRVAEALSGGVDLAVNIPPEDIGRLKSNADTGIVAFNIARNFGLHLRTEPGVVTHDARVREAIDLAINRQELADVVADGYATATRGLFPPEIPNANTRLTATNSFNPDKARQLIQAAGAKGAKIRFGSPSGRYIKDREVSEAIVGYLQDVGLNAQLEVQEWSIYNARVGSDSHGEIYFWGMGSYTDASFILNMGSLKRFNPHWKNAEFERLAAELPATTGEKERQAIIWRAQEIITQDRARIGVLYPKAIYSVNKRVQFAGRFDEMIPAEQVRRA